MGGVSMVRLLAIAAVVIAGTDVARGVEAQAPAQQSAYPVPPRSLGEAEEIALALTAAPDEIASRADASGVRVGAWSPHLMLMLPGVAPDQLGLAPASAVDIIQIHDEGNGRSELIVKVPAWSDGKPVAHPGPPPS